MLARARLSENPVQIWVESVPPLDRTSFEVAMPCSRRANRRGERGISSHSGSARPRRRRLFEFTAFRFRFRFVFRFVMQAERLKVVMDENDCVSRWAAECGAWQKPSAPGSGFDYC